jgi:hypothetical protein
MNGLNIRSVLVAGLLAGLVLNVGYAVGEMATADELNRMLTRLSLPAPGGGAMLGLAVMGFGLGVVLVWLYAAMRPRFGAGARTALLAGGVVWALACLLPNLSLLTFGILTPTHTALASLADAVVVPLAALAGARAYREAETVRLPGSAVAGAGR